MPCTPITTEDGGVMILCGRGRQPRVVCHVCGARPMTRLCDKVVDQRPRTQLRDGLRQRVTVTTTYSKPLCDACSHHVAPDLDYCPAHVPAEG